MWRYFQPHPYKLNIGDCTIRAACAVTGKSWDTAFKEICAVAYEMKDMPSANRVFGAYMAQYGFGKQRLIDQCPDCLTVAEFAEDHPHGVYILGPHEHVVALINGDWWDSYDSGSMIPTYYFRRF